MLKTETVKKQIEFNEFSTSRFVVGSKGRNHHDDGWHVSWFKEFVDGVYVYTMDITEAKLFTMEELIDWVIYPGAHGYHLIIKDVSLEWLDRIKNNKDIIKRMSTLENF